MTTCAECGSRARLVTGQAIYPHRPDLHSRSFWRCQCGAYVGCHRGTTTALGTCAGPELRRMRNLAHACFDRLWKGRRLSRTAAYRWMQEAMGLDASAAHIGLFSIEQCRRLITLVADRDTSQEHRHG